MPHSPVLTFRIALVVDPLLIQHLFKSCTGAHPIHSLLALMQMLCYKRPLLGLNQRPFG